MSGSQEFLQPSALRSPSTATPLIDALSRDTRPSRGGRRVRWNRIPLLLVLFGVSVLFLYPFVWLVSASLKPQSEVFDNAFIPHHWQFENFVTIWREVPIFTWIVNSVTVAFAAATTVTISSSMVAFGFAHFRFRFRGQLFALVLATMALPAAVTMIPTYLIWSRLGFVNTQVPLWAQNLFGSAFYIFLLRQFFLGLPREMFEAARVDGCSYARMFWSLALPLCRPALVVVFVFEVQASWTDLLKPLIYLQTPSLYTIPRGLKAVVDQFGQGGEYHWEIVMAASLIATVPMIIIFAFAQRFFIDGVATTGRKG